MDTSRDAEEAEGDLSSSVDPLIPTQEFTAEAVESNGQETPKTLTPTHSDNDEPELPGENKPSDAQELEDVSSRQSPYTGIGESLNLPPVSSSECVLDSASPEITLKYTAPELDTKDTAVLLKSDEPPSPNYSEDSIALEKEDELESVTASSIRSFLGSDRPDPGSVPDEPYIKTPSIHEDQILESIRSNSVTSNRSLVNSEKANLGYIYDEPTINISNKQDETEGPASHLGLANSNEDKLFARNSNTLDVLGVPTHPGSVASNLSNISVAGSENPDPESVPDEQFGEGEHSSEAPDDFDIPTEDESMDETEAEAPRLSSPCRYRWSNILNSKSSDVGFFASYAPKDPILLSWDEKAKAYFSSELRMVCGDHHGNLIVDGKDYEVEEYAVRSYSFEIDLYIKEDVIEDEVAVSESKRQEIAISEQQDLAKNVDTYQDVSPLPRPTENGSRPSSKIEDLLKHQLHDEEPTKLDAEDLFPSSSKRHSPIGDDSSENFNSERLSDEVQPASRSYGDELNIAALTSTQSPVLPNKDVIEDIVAGTPISLTSSQRSSRAVLEQDMQAVDTVPSPGPRPTSVGSQKGSGSQLGSARQSPANDGIYGRPEVRGSARFMPAHDDPSVTGRPSPSLRPTSASNNVSDQIVHMSSASRHTPLIDSVERPGSESRRTPLAEPDQRPYASPSAARTPPRSADGSRERSYENGVEPSSRHSSRPGSKAQSQTSSRPQSVGSMSSEVELAQYMETFSQSGSMERLCPQPAESHPDESLTDPPIFHRPERAISAPMHDTGYQFQPEKRSSTPDNRVRVLPPADPASFRSKQFGGRTEVNQGRSSVASNVSHASSRTITPVSAEAGHQERDSDRIQDLEKSIVNLRKLLSSRESEVHSMSAQIGDLKDINRALKEELEHRSKRHTPVSTESSEFLQLQSEKEILAQKVVALQEDVTRLSRSQSGSGRNSASSGISDYSPTHPSVLQRKLADLEAQLRDQQEANEATIASLHRAEEKIRLLQTERRDVKEKTLKMSDLQGDSDQHLRVELMTLQEDVKSLKERNFHLTEENMKLREASSVKPLTNENLYSTPIGPRLTSSQRSETRESRPDDIYRSNRDIPPAHPQSSTHRQQTKLYREDLAPKQLRHSFNRSYESDTKLTDTSTKLLQERDRLESAKIRQYTRDPAPTSTRSTDPIRNGLSYPDRSKPDGEVSEKLYTDRSGLTKSYDRKITDSYRSEHITTSYTDRQSTKVGRSTEDPFDKYKPSNDAVWNKDSKTSSYSQRSLTTGGAISSSDIFFNLQQKRANQWSLKDNPLIDAQNASDDYDSDSTAILMCKEPTGQVASVREEKRRGRDRERTNYSLDKYLSGNLEFQRLSTKGDEGGEDSDTATDILLAQDSTLRGISNGRRNSVDSDGSVSPLSDVDEALDRGLHRRSKSVDGNRSSLNSLQSTTLQRSGSATRPLTSLDTMRGSAGHRSVIPAPLVTQHNKGELAKKGGPSHFNSTMTNGLRPFAPRNAADIRVDDVVKFSRVGGKLTLGAVKYIGHLPGRGEVYLGVELDKDEGKHDGTFEGIRYFKCKPNKGVFVAFNKVVMAWAP